MSQLGVTVTTNQLLQGGAGIPVGTGNAFFAGTTDQGPPPAAATSPYIKCQSINDYVTAFGPRSTTSAALYDAVDTFFQEGGSVCYVIRVTDGTATTATLTLNDSGARPSVVVSALTPGLAGNNVFIVATVASSRLTIRVQDSGGNVLETLGPYAATSAMFTDTSSAYVTFSQSAASGFTTNLPVAITSTALRGGADANDLTDASAVAALDGFPATLGPGTVALPGYTSTTAWSGLRAHGKARNRFAAQDLADAVSAATLTAAVASVAAATDASWGIFATSTCKIPGITPGTTRTVAASAVIAALRARVAATGNDNQAPAGRKWPLQYVTGFTNTYSDADMATLSGAGINTFAVRYGVPCLFGFVTAALPTTEPIFWEAGPACERMALVAEGGQVLEDFLFDTLDGRNVTITAAQGALQGLVAQHWADGALFGETAADAGSVIVGPPVNTLATEQAGQLNANLRVRISPTAQAINLVITSVPITQTI